METIFDNLFLYEIVMLFLGVFLFMLLCAGLVYYIIKRDDIKKLLFFFLIPIIMIGYPSIQEIQIEKDKFALRKFSNEVIENPNDTVAKNELIKVTEKLEKRATAIGDLRAVAEANLLLGNPDKAIDLTNKAIKSEVENLDEDEIIKDISGDSLALADQQRMIHNVETLEGIKAIATIQKEFKNDPSTLKDTVLLREQIRKVQWENPKTEKYLNKKIIVQAKTDRTTKQ